MGESFDTVVAKMIEKIEDIESEPIEKWIQSSVFFVTESFLNIPKYKQLNVQLKYVRR